MRAQNKLSISIVNLVLSGQAQMESCPLRFHTVSAVADRDRL